MLGGTSLKVHGIIRVKGKYNFFLAARECHREYRGLQWCVWFSSWTFFTSHFIFQGAPLDFMVWAVFTPVPVKMERAVMQWQDSAFVLWVITVSTVKKVLVPLWWQNQKQKNKTKNRTQKTAYNYWNGCWEPLLPYFELNEYPETLNLGQISCCTAGCSHSLIN